MPSLPSNTPVLETHLPTLWGAQNYLQALLDDKAPDSLVAGTWDDFYRLYDGLIRRFVVAQGVPQSDVDDCVQEVWTEVAARLVKFDRPADRPGLRAWLFALVRSKATNVYRKRARQPAASLDDLISGGHEPGHAEDDPAALYEQQWEKTILETVFDQLREEMSPTNVQVMQMRLIDHRTVAEVSSELHMPPALIHARQHRILKKLRARVALYTGDPLGAEFA